MVAGYCDFVCGHFGLGVGFPGGGIGEGAEHPLQNVSLEISHGIGQVEGRAASSWDSGFHALTEQQYRAAGS